MNQEKKNFFVKIAGKYGKALKTQIWLRWVHAVLVIQIFIAWLWVHPDLSKSVEPPHIIENLFGIALPLGGFNPITVGMTWFVMLLLIGFALYVSKTLKERPSRIQIAAEKIVGVFTMLCEDTLGQRGKAFVPLIGTIFLFVWFSNLVGIIPFPYFEEPTSNVNFTLSLGLISFVISHTVAIRVKGFSKWIQAYFIGTPFYLGFSLVLFIVSIILFSKIYPLKMSFLFSASGTFLIGALLKKMALPFRFYIPNPLEMIGEVGKVVSHSMRLFGNIFGGVIIMVVISKLTYYIFFPTLLSGFFGIFVGTVQAFVFTMLALVYTAVLIAEE